MTIVAEIGRHPYVSLVTYRRDGTAVPTTVWHVVDGRELFVISEAAAGKVKRIRRDPRVVVTVSSYGGKIAPGAPTATGTARLLDDAGTTAVRTLIARKYFSARLGYWFARVLRLRRPPGIGIAIVLADGP